MIRSATTTNEIADRPPDAPPAARDALSISFRPAEHRQAVLRDWRCLESRLGDVSLACSADWTEAWLTHFGEAVPHRFAVARRSALPVGVCLVTEGVAQRTGPIPVKSIHLGTAGEPESDSVCVEYNDVLVAGADRAEFLSGLLGRLHRERAWDELRFDGMTAASLQSLPTAETTWHVDTRDSYYFDLAGSRNAQIDSIAQFGHATRKNIRKNLNAYGDLQTEWAETTDHAESIFEDLIRLHQARWNADGKPGCYASKPFENFHRDLIARLIPSGRMGLFRVRSGGDVVGCLQLFIDRNRALVYQAGSAPYSGRQSPGMIADVLCIEECLRRGFDAYDFLAGDSHHKRKLSTHRNQLVWAVYRRPRWKFQALRVARRLKREVRSVVSKTKRAGQHD